MPTNGAQNNFATWQPPLGDATRRDLILDLDAQVFEVVDSWARDHGATLAAVVDQVIIELAGEVLAAAHPDTIAARELWIDRFDLDRLIDRSIRPAPVACGKPYPSADPQTTNAPAGFDGGVDVQPPTVATGATDRAREILDYYSALTGNRIKPADFSKCKLVVDLPNLVIQCGILHAVCYATRPVGSFAYCVRAMENFLDAYSDLDAICETLIDKVLRKRATGQIVLPLAGEKLLIGEFNQES